VENIFERVQGKSSSAHTSRQTILKVAQASKTLTLSQLCEAAAKGSVLSLSSSATEQGEAAQKLTAE
jgi:hypothetical protein